MLSNVAVFERLSACCFVRFAMDMTQNTELPTLIYTLYFPSLFCLSVSLSLVIPDRAHLASGTVEEQECHSAADE